MTTQRRLRRWLRFLRRTPFHPQWLVSRPTDLASWIKANARGKVLDIGCADRWVERSLPAGCRYVGLDYPATGGALYSARPDVFATALQLPFMDSSFDTVVLTEVLEHLSEPTVALDEVRRVLRPDGSLLLSMPFLYPVHDAPHDFQRFTRHGLAHRLQSAGLVATEIEPMSHSLRTAGALMCLALAGSALRMFESSRLLLPLAVALLLPIPLVNLISWAMSAITPHWPAFSMGTRVRAHRPAGQDLHGT